MRGTWREDSFTGDPKKHVKYGSGMGICFPRGTTFGEHGGMLFSWGL